MVGTVQEQAMNTAGPPGLMESVVQEHEVALLRYASRLVCNPFAAQDVVQNVFITLFRKYQDGMQPTHQLKSWLYRVTHNEAVDHIRKESRRRKLHEKAALEIEVPGFCGASGDVSIEERKALVLEQLGQLHPREQQVVLLRLEEGLSYAQIAEITGRSEGNVGNILHHAVLKLSRSLSKGSAGKGDAQ